MKMMKVVLLGVAMALTSAISADIMVEDIQLKSELAAEVKQAQLDDFDLANFDIEPMPAQLSEQPQRHNAVHSVRARTAELTQSINLINRAETRKRHEVGWRLSA